MREHDGQVEIKFPEPNDDYDDYDDVIIIMIMTHSFCDINSRGGHPNAAINSTPTHPHCSNTRLLPSGRGPYHVVTSESLVSSLHVPLSG